MTVDIRPRYPAPPHDCWVGPDTIFVTHGQEEAKTICDRIAVMNDVVAQQIGTLTELHEKPARCTGLRIAAVEGIAAIMMARQDSIVSGVGAMPFQRD